MASGDVIKMVLQVDDKASGPVKKVGTATAQAGKQAKKAKTDYAQLAGKLVAFGLAAKAVTASVSAMTQGLADSRNELADTATRTGITAETLAGLRLAAEGSGLSLGNLSGSLALFPKRMRDMQAGIGESKRAFEELGVSVVNADGSLRDADTVLKEALSAITKLPDATSQAAVATELFGRSGTALLQALSGTELEDFVEQAKMFGIDIGPQAAKSAADYQREVAQLSMVSEKSASIMAEAFGMDGVGKVLKGLGAAMLALSTLFKGVMDTMRDVFGLFVEKFEIRFSFLMDLLDAAKIALGGDFKAAAEEAGKGLDTMGQRLQAFEVTRSKVLADALSGKIVKEAIEAGAQFMTTTTAGKGSGRGQGEGDGDGDGEENKEEQQNNKEDQKAAQKAAEEAAAALNGLLVAQKSLLELEKELLKAQREMPLKVAEGSVGALSSPFASLTSMMGPAGGLVSALSEMGKAGSKTILKGLRDSIKGVIKALVEVIPDLLVELPKMLIDMLPMVIDGLFDAIPALVDALIFKLPPAIVQALFQWWGTIWQSVKDFLFPSRERRKERRAEFRSNLEESGIGNVGQSLAMLFTSTLSGLGGRELFNRRMKKHTGTSHIDRTGMFLLQAGEQVVPSSGTTTQGMARRMGGGGGMNVTINTNVVDQNSIRGLGKLLEQEFASFGRSTSPLLNSPTGSRG